MEERVKEIEQNRKECDPIHRVFHDPCAETINMFLETGMKHADKASKGKVTAEKCTKVMFDLLLSNRYDNEDGDIKLFAFFLFACKQPLLADAIAESYDTTGGIFEELGPPMFRQMLIKANQFIQETFLCNTTKNNVVHRIRDFVKALRHQYNIGM